MNSELDRISKAKRSFDPANSRRNGEREVRVITLEENILEENDRIASRNRAHLQSKGIISLNLMSSPGSGKTTLLVETLKQLKDEIPCGVIEGDQQTSNDARRIAATDVPVVQINTRQSCHLDAFHVQKAFHELPLDKIRILFIENVGNLICPAAFDLGETEKIAIMSITEGEDKPIKYPLTFHLASLLILTKMDLLPHLQFDVDLCKQYVHQVNPGLRIIETSSYTHQGFIDWFEYLRSKV